MLNLNDCHKIPRNILLGVKFLIVSVTCCYFAFAIANTPISIRLPADKLFVRGKIQCGQIGSRWLAGTLAKDDTTFTSYANLLKSLKRDLTRASNYKRAKIVNKIIKVTKQNSDGNKICRKGPEIRTPTVTPIATSLPTPAPTSSPQPVATETVTQTPTPNVMCYDSQGNTSCYGIPEGLVGNKMRGATFYPGYCSCHENVQLKVNRSYNQIITAFMVVSEMQPYGSYYSSQEIADIVAYLNGGIP